MAESTRELWRRQERHAPGDRQRLFAAVADVVDVRTVLYPGSYVDLAPSFVFDDVTYVDVDRRARRFFDDEAGVAAILRDELGDVQRTFRLVHADYTETFETPHDRVDLLVSLYAGFVSEHCAQHLRVGGALLVNSSHGDVAMASIDERFELTGVVSHRDGSYRVSTNDLDRCLVPKRPVEISRDLLHDLGRGIAYTTSPHSYLFTRVR